MNLPLGGWTTPIDEASYKGVSVHQESSDDWRLKFKLPDDYAPVSDLLIGKPSEKLSYFNDGIDKIAHNLVSLDQLRSRNYILEQSPFWLEVFQQNQIPGFSPGAFEHFLILYRLAEACRTAIELLIKQDSFLVEKFQNTRILLTRQIFIFLSYSLEISRNNPAIKINEYIPDIYDSLRRLREEYASILVEKEARVSIALSWAAAESATSAYAAPTLSLEKEVGLLFFELKTPSNLKPFQLSSKLRAMCFEKPLDRQLTDFLLRRWYLSKNDLFGAARIIRLLLDTDSGSWLLKPRNFLVAYQNGFIFLGGLLILAGSGLGIEWPVYCAVGLVVVSAIAIVWTVKTNKTLLSSAQILYPLALRIPAMGMVGVLAIAGITEEIRKIGFNVQNEPIAAGIIIAASFLLAFAYIYLEVLSRMVNSPGTKKFIRAFILWLFGWGNTIWISAAVAWLSTPLGLNCASADAPGVKIAGWPIHFWFVVFISAMALFIGIFTQIFWEDKAIGEPL